MKNKSIINNIFLVFLSVLLGTSTLAQTAKKNSTRLKIEYVKITNGEVVFNAKASSRVKRKNINLSNISLTFFNEVNDESLILGTITTDSNGQGKLTLDNINSIQPDSTNVYTIKVAFKGNDSFKKASKSISFRNANINAKLITKDSVNYITATLKDVSSDSLISNTPLTIQLQRLFRPLFIGEEFNVTDEDGTILVSIEEGLPGVNGNLTFEVILSESDEYGTVKAIVNAPIGKPIVDESTFDQRTMWSPRNKTPLFLLIFPNILIFGIWGLIIYLFINLFRISKN
ncbi:MAG: hypothetical protein IZT56_08175 [Bacteroidetes bacterium]|nr:hypothetical protein [Bacteroidota bacterium]